MDCPYVGRTAPSASGPPHAGTLYSAWLAKARADAQRGVVWGRIDDLDGHRVRTASIDALARMLEVLGYAPYRIVLQSDRLGLYHNALDALARQNLLYRCTCAKARIRALGRPLADGGFGYDNACRPARLAVEGWRTVDGAVRVALPAATETTARAGDPIVRRRDGSIAYALASVVDDIALGVTEVVRGRDLQGVMDTQIALFRLLQASPPAFLHHGLLLADDGKKLSKSAGDGQAWTYPDIRRVLRAFPKPPDAWGNQPFVPPDFHVDLVDGRAKAVVQRPAHRGPSAVAGAIEPPTTGSG